jgi:DNA primase
MISNRTIELVRMQVNIKDVVSDYATLHPSGSSFKCCCPLHHEKTPSLHINPARNTWHCFGCGEGGDDFCSLTDEEAARAMARFAEPEQISQAEVEADMGFTIITLG